jgi:hypothetical protein
MDIGDGFLRLTDLLYSAAAIWSDLPARARVRGRESAKTRVAVRNWRSICPCSPWARKSRGRRLSLAPSERDDFSASTPRHTTRSPLGRNHNARCLHQRSEPQQRCDARVPDDRSQQGPRRNLNTASRLELRVEHRRLGNGSCSSLVSVPAYRLWVSADNWFRLIEQAIA